MKKGLMLLTLLLSLIFPSCGLSESELAGEGVGTVINASADSDVASFSLELIKQRQIELFKRRTVIAAKLG